MNMRKIEIRPSAGKNVPASDIHPLLVAYCQQLVDTAPRAALATGAARLDLVALYLAANTKVALANNGAFTVALERPWQHEVDELHPDHWIETYPIAHMFEVKFTVQGSIRKQYFSISFGEDIVVPQP